MNTKNIYYEHDNASGTSIGVKYEKYLYRCQSKFQNIEVNDSTQPIGKVVSLFRDI